MENGYIKLYRKICDSACFANGDAVRLWIYLLTHANYKDREVMIGNQIVNVKAGQFLTGREKLASILHLNRSKIERLLKTLESEHQIEQQTKSKYRIISICNWEKYQVSEQQNEHQMSTKRAPDEHQTSTTKKDKKDNNDNKYSVEFMQFWAAYPNKVEKPYAFQRWNKIKRPAIDIILTAIENQKVWRENSNGAFRPQWKHPAVWLNKGCWDDVLDDNYGKENKHNSQDDFLDNMP